MSVKVKATRKWTLVINNPVDHGFDHDQIKTVLAKFKSVTYWCFGDEIGEEETYHTHLFFYSPTPIRFETVKNRFPSAHIEPALGTASENRDYFLKQGKEKNEKKAHTKVPDTFEEFGELPDEHQGRRTDLNMLYDCVKSGLSTYEILEIDPKNIKLIDKIDRTREVIRSEEFRSKFRVLDVTYQSGSSGVGKTRGIYDQYGFDNVYRVTDKYHPWDTYHGQDVVVFEEFFDTFRIQDMLNYLDGYPLDLPSRYSNKVACYTKVFINSNVPLEKLYHDVQLNFRDTWYAFLRRIHHVVVFDDKGVKKVYEKTEEYLHRWSSVDPKNIPFDQKN